tara:strand:+ start:97 stop:816 length:720 start_codon:yes stop_codon:yes gene_type:complete
LTEKQKKFAEILCSSEGLLSNQECAIEAGYSKDSAYARAHELMNPKICPHVVKYIHEIKQEYKTKYVITKDSHMAELWRIREEAKKKGRALVWLRAEEMRGKLMGYYIDRKESLNVNKSLNELTEEDLEKRMNDIHTKYSHFIDLDEPERKIINAEIEGDRKVEKYKTAFELARKMLNKNGLTIGDPENEIVQDIKHLNKIRDEDIETDEQKKVLEQLQEHQNTRRAERNKSKLTKEKI